LSFQDDDRVKTVSHCSDLALWPDATTISNQRALNGNMDNVEGQDVLRKRGRRTTNFWCGILMKKYLFKLM
jgi:hypothetical protein